LIFWTLRERPKPYCKTVYTSSILVVASNPSGSAI
jgi:hypothetical protein